MWCVTAMVWLMYALDVTATCPCDDPKWCEPVSQTYEHEVYAFIVSNDNWKLYDWDKITSIAQFSKRDDDMMCYAHSKGVRVVSAGAPSLATLVNTTARGQWVKGVVQDITDRHLDGFNLDFETAIPPTNKTERDALTFLVRELRQALLQVLKHPQITFDGTFGPDQASRYYDYVSMAPLLDFVFIMAYDMAGVTRRPIAWANSPINYTHPGIEAYLKLGIPAEKLVLGLPWYGYVYPCLSLSPDNVCEIPKVPFRGVNCSDAAGSQSPYSKIIEDLLPKSTSGLLWDQASASPYFNYQDSNGQTYQVWFDNVMSLKAKYDLAVTLGLRGVGMWEADSLDYTNTTQGQQQRREMWGALPTFKKYGRHSGGKRENGVFKMWNV